MNMQDFNTYQTAAFMTVKESVLGNKAYFALGLAGETGEVLELVKKSIRDETEVDVDKLTKEIGDVIWYCSQLAVVYGIDFKDVARVNLEKLADRKNRGVISGSGDNR